MEKEILAIVFETLSENMELMFQKKSTPDSNFRICNRPDFSGGFIGTISMANQTCQGQIVICLTEETVEDLLADVMQLVSSPDEVDELVKSSLGELLNIVSGSFVQKEKVYKKYGSLDLSTPIFWNKDESPYFCKADGAIGSVIYHNGNTIDLFLAVNPYKVFEPSEDCLSDVTDILGDDLDDLLNSL